MQRMNMMTTKYSSPQMTLTPPPSRGFTLIELMVSIVLSLFLTAIAAQSYLASKVTYTATNQSAKIQENIRFASYFLNKELRQAGNFGCFQKVQNMLNLGGTNSNNRALLDISRPINVWRYRVGGNNFDLSGPDAFNVPNLRRGRWRNDANHIRPALLNNRAMEGSDILLITKLSEPLDVKLAAKGFNDINTQTLRIQQPHTFAAGQVLLVGNCSRADLFQHRGNNQNVLRNNFITGQRWQLDWNSDQGHEVRALESTLYYIGLGASGLPALFKVDVSQGFFASLPHQEIVDGIEGMKIALGEDAVNGDNMVDRYVNSDDATSIGSILSVQVGLLAVGDENSNDNVANRRVYQLTQLHQMRSPTKLDPGNVNSPDDTRIRHVTNTTVKLRNRGLTRPTFVVN